MEKTLVLRPFFHQATLAQPYSAWTPLPQGLKLREATGHQVYQAPQQVLQVKVVQKITC